MKFAKCYLLVSLTTFSCTCVCHAERVGFSIAFNISADAAGVNQLGKCMIVSTFVDKNASSQVPGGWTAEKILVPLIYILVSSPPLESTISVSLTMSGMYLGEAAAMLVLSRLVKFRGARSLFQVDPALDGSDPPRSKHPKAITGGFGESLLPMQGNQKLKMGNGRSSATKILWKTIFVSLPVWWIALDYTLHVLIKYLPTYFQQGLQLSLLEMSSCKIMPYLNDMFIFSNIGVVAGHSIIRSIFSVSQTTMFPVTKSRMFLNTIGFRVASLAWMALFLFRTSGGAAFCFCVALGFLISIWGEQALL